ncbi:MAG TPA: hypothetical protein VJY62_06525 [Bacteroidia bacterium]|nr:hypothetical protein [Bacteroidia bacterium]
MDAQLQPCAPFGTIPYFYRNKNKMLKQFLSLSLLSVCSQITYAGWQQKTPMPSDGRVVPNVFVIANNAYMAGGFKAGNVYLNEVWQYNTATDAWTQKAAMPANVAGGTAFSMNGKGYVIMGWINGANHGGVYEYDPGLNSWTTKNNFPGSPRYGSCVFLLNNKAYIGLGYSPLYDDLWQYDPANDTWSQKANFPGGVRQSTVHFALNGLGYVGCGVNNLSSYAGLNDFYTYDDVLNSWTQIGNFAGPARHSALSFVLNNKAYVTTGNTGNAPGTTFDDLWEFNPLAGVWTQLSSLPDTARQSGSSFAAGNCGYIFGGMNQSFQSFFSQLWQYCDGTGVEETENSVQANLYPCPGNQAFVFKHSLPVADYRLDIISTEGKIIFSKKIIHPETNISLSSCAQGIYLWKFYLNSEIQKTGKIIM